MHVIQKKIPKEREIADKFNELFASVFSAEIVRAAPTVESFASSSTSKDLSGNEKRC